MMSKQLVFLQEGQQFPALLLVPSFILLNFFLPNKELGETNNGNNKRETLTRSCCSEYLHTSCTLPNCSKFHNEDSPAKKFQQRGTGKSLSTILSCLPVSCCCLLCAARDKKKNLPLWLVVVVGA